MRRPNNAGGADGPGGNTLIVLLNDVGRRRESPHDSLHHGLRPTPDTVFIQLTNRVGRLGDDHVGLFLQTGLPPAKVGECIGGDHHRRNAPALEFNADVATPRCARTSIAGSGDHHIRSMRQIIQQAA
jgi:hypothetical protein